MSLINDALKRAIQAQPKPPTEGESPMHPADPRGSVGLPIYFMPVLLFIISGACYFIVQGWDAHRQSGLYPKPITIHAREVGEAQDPSASARARANSEPVQPIPANRQFSLTDAPAAGVGVVDDTESDFRLQGIFYRPSKPSAMVNSITVYVGDKVSGATVKAITKQSVTLIVGGQTKVLTLR